MHTLDDIKKKEKEEKKKNQHFTGNEFSGQMIEHPEHNDPMVENLLKQAHENALKKMQKKKDQQTQNNVDDDDDTVSKCVITIYENGFQIDGGEFRDFSAPQNKAFLEQLKQGQVPTELRNKYKNGLSVALEDKSKQKYRAPTPPKYIPFSGKGLNLGGQPIAQQEEIKIQVDQQKKIKVNEHMPKTSIQIRYHNGQSKTIEVNLSDKVQSIFDFVRDSTTYKGNFQLVAGFPPKALSLQQTVEEAELMDSTITQKLC